MEQNSIKFVGTNEKLFSRTLIDHIDGRQTLIVPETHNAILVKDGQMLQTLSSGKYLLSDFVDLKAEPDASIEVLFMSKTAKLKLLWGTPQKIDFYDGVLEEDYKVGMSGDFDVQIGDPRKSYLYLVGAAEDLTADALQERLQSTVVSVLEAEAVSYIKENNIRFNQLSIAKKNIAQKVLKSLSHKLLSEYGISVFSFNIANIIIDEEDYKRLSSTRNKGEQLRCEVCGQELLPGAKFCSNCGSKVVDLKCPNCGTINEKGAKFCATCGQKL